MNPQFEDEEVSLWKYPPSTKAVTEVTAGGGLSETMSNSQTQPVSNSQAQPQDCIDLKDELADLRNTVDELKEIVTEQQEEINDLEQTVREQQKNIADLEDELAEERERRGKADAQLRQRTTEAEESLESLEATESADANPSPDADRTPLTPIERLHKGNRDDVAQHVTPSVERAVTLFENLPKWGTSTPKGDTLKPADKPKDLLEAATGESLAWQQYYRAAEALESLSKGAVTFFDHKRYGKMLVLHDDSDVQRRLSETTADSSRVSLAAD
jgi:uncharacterized coiled-coil protein SlyX